MTYVQVKHKYQVTIPATLRKRLNLREGDMLEVQEQNGLLVLIPQAMMQRKPTKLTSPLLAMVGANKGSGLYTSAQDADHFIYALEAHPEFVGQVVALFERIAETDSSSVTSELTLAECLVKPFEKQDAQSQQQYEQHISPSEALQITPIMINELQ